MLQEFRAFILRGNVLDMAIGVIIGVAFGNIVSSLVDDVIMPPIGMLLGRVDVSGLFIDLSGQGYPTLAAAQEAGAPTLNYGNFIQSVLDFLIIAFVIFMVVRVFNRLHRAKEVPAPEPETRACPYCLSSIPVNALRCAYCTSELPAKD